MTNASTPDRIDVHAHLAPPEWIAALSPRGMVIGPSAQWSPEKHLADMAQAGVTTSLLSITTPGLWLGDNASSRTLARACNDYAARLRVDHPRAFGMFTALPLPDVDGALAEIAYGLDVLKADGVGLFTSYGDKWLGDPAFDPVMAELNRRKTVVHVHPTSPDCCRNLVPGIPDAAIEFGTDSTRAIARMVFGGAAARFPDIRLIFSHAGGTMPFLIERFDGLAKAPQYAGQLREGFRIEARRFHYDTAQASGPIAMSALKQIIPVERILFGSDYPFQPAGAQAATLNQCGVFDAAELRAIEHDNALRLMPGLKD
jgi:predicted TIM-barrel fold metal-dependent hydrolase